MHMWYTVQWCASVLLGDSGRNYTGSPTHHLLWCAKVNSNTTINIRMQTHTHTRTHTHTHTRTSHSLSQPLRVYEKMMVRIQERQSTLKGFKKKVSCWSMKKGLKGNKRKQEAEKRCRKAWMHFKRKLFLIPILSPSQCVRANGLGCSKPTGLQKS